LTADIGRLLQKTAEPETAAEEPKSEAELPEPEEVKEELLPPPATTGSGSIDGINKK